MKRAWGLLLLFEMTVSLAQADGLDYWTNRFPSSTGRPTAVGSGDDLIIAREADLLSVYSSTSGQDWVLGGGYFNGLNGLVGFFVSGLAVGGGKIVAVGGPGLFYRTLIQTYSGGQWQVTRETGAGIRASGRYRQVAYGAGTFVAVGSTFESFTSPVNEALISGDGIGWSARSISGVGVDGYLSGVTYGNGMFVAVGKNGVVLASYDGTNWTSAASGTSATLNCVAGGGGQFIAVGNGVEIRSTDGLDWEPVPAVNLAAISRLVYGGAGYFVGVAPGGMIQSTADGIHWTSHGPFTLQSGPMDLFDVAYFKGSFFAVGTIAILQSGAVALFQMSADLEQDTSSLEIKVTGAPGATGRVQVSTNTTDWQDWKSLDGATGFTNLFDDLSSVSRFYRVVSP